MNNNHNNCPVSIRYWTCKNRYEKPALFCKRHNSFIEWITDETANILIADGIPVEDWNIKFDEYTLLKSMGQDTKVKNLNARDLLL